MRILHTADWHLGKRLEQSERTEEHQRFLDWLVDLLHAECIDVLIVAGDVFDSGSPSNAAFEQYYRFLRRVKNTCCREVVIIGGNHDSVSTLHAPKELLRYFNVHIIGGVPDDFGEQIIPINNAAGETELVVCAAPFLRDRDIRLSVAGETVAEREARIRQGISDHYHQFTSYIAPYKAAGVPVVATGHLFAAGASTSESEKEIHVGNLGQISVDLFPDGFDYIALGHIHRPQLINKTEWIRYPGSPIPLSFSETNDQKLVIILAFEAGKLQSLEEKQVPVYRKLLRIKGGLDQVKQELLVVEDHQACFPAWIEVQVETDSYIHNLNEELNELISGRDFIDRLFVRQIKLKPNLQLDEQTEEGLSLTDLDPKTVFLKRCEWEHPAGDHSLLLQTFEEALERMSQKE
ncbi:MAG: exonuclease SbcCD subunit D C-terminal domain-containing protein [Williamsia sp.]|nr:exonuclease SbcCD subunit D C-terminal domain-containing protein [Williamsia sp.]